MLVSDLPDPVNAMKADWLVASTWIGFTPQGKGGDAAQKCQSAINNQTGSGYVVEYITKNIDKPNAGFEDDAEHLEEQERHAANAGAAGRRPSAPAQLEESQGDSGRRQPRTPTEHVVAERQPDALVRGFPDCRELRN